MGEISQRDLFAAAGQEWNHTAGRYIFVETNAQKY